MRNSTTANHTQWLLIGSPDCPRLRLFAGQLRRIGAASPICLSYFEFLDNANALFQKLIQQDFRLLHVKLETPGAHRLLNARLIYEGIRQHMLSNPGNLVASPTLDEISHISSDKGRLVFLDEWFRGFKYTLNIVSELLNRVCSNTSRTIQYLNTPQDILAMFDKAGSIERLRKAGVNTPGNTRRLPRYAELKELMRKNKQYRIFIKPNYSASAAGIIAFQFHPRLNRVVAFTTIESVITNQGIKFYNSLKLKKIACESTIEKIVNFLADNHAYFEPWVPKPQFTDKHYDVRAIVINGKVSQMVARLSDGPITNLHLGNQRKPISALELDRDTIAQYKHTAERAMQNFPNALYAGLDIVLPKSCNRAMVLEVNAFGDYIKESSHPNSTDLLDNRVYAAQICASFERVPRLQ